MRTVTIRDYEFKINSENKNVGAALEVLDENGFDLETATAKDEIKLLADYDNANAILTAITGENKFSWTRLSIGERRVLLKAFFSDLEPDLSALDEQTKRKIMQRAMIKGIVTETLKEKEAS